ncbi:hypothetical protein [Knoellia subterranea]|uniref:Uncharacterized protein n=1 Tax=Knoellia subterranea KCTC 19937 TaxID=1385521 RepID=A0A0A0JQ43_9MICO|nr:hypothetical protein [Knoellia subterranea]KGN38859.1 hypothetical protein N803_06995 [Knoellia subterranea KCTC 19937]
MDADTRLDAAVGSVAEEAAKLLEALGRSAAPRGERRADDSDASDTPTGEHVHVAVGDAESCTWCPVCRSVTALRGVSPETMERLADLAAAAATLFADLASRHTPTSETRPRATPGDRTPRTEPIAVVDEEDVP